jgi:CRP/FNR family transcriptional regulator, cyclic AMP receptor protein
VKTYHPLEDIDSVISILSRISVWGGLTEEQQSEIYQRLEVGTFRKGEYVFRKGDQPSHIYILKSGKIEIVTSDQDVSIRKETVETGGCFGVIALMAVQTYTGTAMAVEDTEVMVLSRQALLELYHEDIKLFALLIMNIAREIARKLTITDEVLLQCIHERKDG